MAKCDPYYRDPRSRQDALNFPCKSKQGYYHKSKIDGLNAKMWAWRDLLTELIAEGLACTARQLTAGYKNDNRTGLIEHITINDGNGGYYTFSNEDEVVELVKSIVLSKVTV